MRESNELVDEIRRALVTASTWALIKLLFRLCVWPWLIARVVDVRLPMDQRMSVAVQFVNCIWHDLDAYFCRPLRLELRKPEDLFSPRKQRMICWWARAHRLTSQRSENRHAANRRSLAKTTDYKHFISVAVNQEAHRGIDVHREMGQELDDHGETQSQVKSSGPITGLMTRWGNECQKRDHRLMDSD